MSVFSVVVTGQSLITRDVRQARDDRFDEVLRFLQQGDVAFTNFESTVLGRHGGWPTKGKYFGYSRPDVLDALKVIGFNALALSNNHAFDLGPSGVLSTLDEVKAQGFLYAGIGADMTEAAEVGHRRLGDRDVALLALDAGPGPANMYAGNRTAFRPARPGVNALKTVRKIGVPIGQMQALRALARELQMSDLERANYAQPEDPPEIDDKSEIDLYGTIFKQAETCGRLVEVDLQSASEHLAAIRESAALGDFVIAYLHHHHWEPNWQQVPSWVQGFARMCVDAGAGLFVSHGAPVLQAIEIYRRAPIFYGLGNFLFHTEPDESEWSPPEVWQSVVAACRYEGDDLVAIDLLPIVINGQVRVDGHETASGLVPLAATGDTARHILEQLAERSRPFGVEVAIADGFGRIVPRD
ncbi:poly-gamma-glutamate synthesis protein (capsule biosynthesis protein) [Ensifer sp. YR511]|nr:poly-gamma-glutamate synthesis protein (capsule biosynthesis protein) [Ensifer sp. YR511]